jgi:Abortive infection C-terminus
VTTITPRAKQQNRSPRLSRPLAKCLATLLNAQLDGTPIEFQIWRAQNAKRIPLIDELQRTQMIMGGANCFITFWGLMNASSKRGRDALKKSERVFKVLRKHYTKHPKDPISIEDLAEQTQLSQSDVHQSARFLASGAIHLGLTTKEDIIYLNPHEQYVTCKGFANFKEMTRKQNTRVANSVPLSLLGNVPDFRLGLMLENSECEEVRLCWQKALERMVSDPSGAITAARSLVEAACKYVLDEHGVFTDKPADLPALYKSAAKLLEFDERSAIDETFRGVLFGSANIVHGLSHLRNTLSDAHGKGRHSPKPARRHSDFVVMIAGAMAGFLLATLDARRIP